MSIIHEALRKRSTRIESVETSDSQPARDSAPPANLPTVLIGAVSVAVIALAVYAGGRAPEVTVFNVTPTSVGQTSRLSELPEASAAAISEPQYASTVSGIPYTFPGIGDPNPPASLTDYEFVPMYRDPNPEPAPASGAPVIIPVKPVKKFSITDLEKPPAAAVEQPAPARETALRNPAGPTIVKASADQIPVSLGALPAGAVTIELADVKVESISGIVIVDGSASEPGALMKVGSTISSDAGAASLAFTRANMEIGPHTSVRINRLERHAPSSGGASREEVTVELQKGELNTIMHSGEGSVLVSTSEVVASTNSGAFTVRTNPDQSVTVSSIGGLVKVVPLKNRQETFIVKTNESLTFRDGKRQ